MKEKNNNDKKLAIKKDYTKHMTSTSKKIFIIVSLGIIATLLFGTSYAWLTFTLASDKSSTLKAGNLSLSIGEAASGITLKSAYPMTDSNGLKEIPYEFTLINNGTIDSEYTIYLDDLPLDSGKIRLPDSVIKYNLEKNGVSLKTELLSTTGINPNRVLDTGTIEPNTTYTYKLRLWLDEDMTNTDAGKNFKGKIRIEAIQTTLDEYVKENLILNFDGIKHGETKNIWTDLSPSSTNGTMLGFDYNSVSGWNNKALTFDDVDDYVQIPSSTTKITDRYTVEYVINPIPSNTTWNTIFSTSSNSDFTIWSKYQKTQFMNSAFATSYDDIYSTKVDISSYLGNPFQVTVTAVKGGDTKTYINGVLVDTSPAGSTDVNYNTYYIGDLRANRGLFYGGDIYSIKLYNSILTEKQINQNYSINKMRFGF